MTSLQLPRFDIPDLEENKLSAYDYYLLNMENIKRLQKQGRLQDILEDPLRIPVDARFSF